MSEAQGTLFEPEFNRSIKVQTFSKKLISHAGAVLLREADHRLGLVESLAEKIYDPRHPKKVRYTATELLRERLYALAMGSENQDDLDRLAHDPAMRMAVWNRPGEEVLAHYRRRGTFEDQLGEFNEVIGPHLSSREFVENEVTMLLAMLAFNMTTMLRNEFEAAVDGSWDLRRFQQSVLRAGGRVVKGARRLWLHIEESVSSLWKVMMKQIGQLRLASQWSSPHGTRRRDWVPPPPHSNRSLVLRG